ncbi:MAG: hypothetical protein ACFFBH_05140 [Promethearchaeota archaeon]
MEEFGRSNIKIRNIALILILIAILILSVWLIYYLLINKNELQFLLAIGIALLFAGILLLTRIQYLIWMLKKVQKSTV